MLLPTSKGSCVGERGPCGWQQAFINDRSPTLLWIGGPWQTIAVVGMLEEQRRFLKRPWSADRCCWKDERGVGASVPSQVWGRQGWQNTCDILPFTLMISLYRFSYMAMIKDTGGRGSDCTPLTAPPRSTCLPHYTRFNMKLHWGYVGIFFKYINCCVTLLLNPFTVTVSFWTISTKHTRILSLN